jgi:hypothetical protein
MSYFLSKQMRLCSTYQLVECIRHAILFRLCTDFKQGTTSRQLKPPFFDMCIYLNEIFAVSITLQDTCTSTGI